MWVNKMYYNYLRMKSGDFCPKNLKTLEGWWEGFNEPIIHRLLLVHYFAEKKFIIMTWSSPLQVE